MIVSLIWIRKRFGAGGDDSCRQIRREIAWIVGNHRPMNAMMPESYEVLINPAGGEGHHPVLCHGEEFRFKIADFHDDDVGLTRL